MPGIEEMNKTTRRSLEEYDRADAEGVYSIDKNGRRVLLDSAGKVIATYYNTPEEMFEDLDL